MKATLLAVILLLSFASGFAQEKNAPTYEEGTVVEAPAHNVYVVETATIRFKIFGRPALELKEVVHFRLDKGHKSFVIMKNGKEYKYWLNEQDARQPEMMSGNKRTL
jgi:hypothetical protein